MQRRGYIHGKTETKFLILYIMARLVGGVNLDTMTELVLVDGAVDYFEFAVAMAELVETEHLTLEDGLYTITEKGRTNGEICEDSLRPSVKKKCDRNVLPINDKLKREAQNRGSYMAMEDDTFRVTLEMDDDTGNLFKMELTAGSEEQASHIVNQFKAHTGAIYNGILDALLRDYDVK